MQAIKPSHLLVLLAICAFSACEKVPLTAPTGSTITVVTSSTSVPINGSVDVIATVTEAGGTPTHNGTLVTFVGSFGRFEPAEATTSGGRAVVKFIGTSSGTTKITAISGGVTAESADVKVGGAAAGSVAMRSEPATLPQGGGTTQIVAVVRDGSGNLLPGAPVNFTSDQGNLGSTATNTDANGEARVSLTTNRDTVVTANVISGVSATTNVRIINAPSVTIAVAAGSTPNAGTVTNFTVTPVNVTGGTSIQNVAINWGDGTPVQNLGPISGATNVTHTFPSVGSYTVVATASDATGQQSSSTISVNVQRLVPVVTLTPSGPVATTVGSTLAFSVSAVPATGGPPIQNITVRQNGAVVYSGASGGSFAVTFNTPGTQSMIATATDTAGTTGSATTIVNVGNAEASLTASGAGLNCSGTPQTCTGLAGGTNVTFTANVTSPGVTAQSYAWNWGDGSPVEHTNVRVNSHVYAAAGSYVPQVTITTTSGATASQVVFLRP